MVGQMVNRKDSRQTWITLFTSILLGMGVTDMEAARPSAETPGAVNGSRAVHITSTRKRAVRREAVIALAVGIDNSRD